MKRKILISALLVITVFTFIYADDDDHYRSRERGEGHERGDDHHEKRSRRSSRSKKRVYYKVNDPLYKSECGACHFAYQPEMLPKRSWEKLMGGLENHFDSDATLEKEDHGKILKYLKDNAGDSKKIEYGYFRALNRSIEKSGDTPIRISDVRYFKHEHKKIPKRYIEQKEVISLSHCNKCHTRAEEGRYGERDIRIPNYGTWDD